MWPRDGPLHELLPATRQKQDQVLDAVTKANVELATAYRQSGPHTPLPTNDDLMGPIMRQHADKGARCTLDPAGRVRGGEFLRGSGRPPRIKIQYRPGNVGRFFLRKTIMSTSVDFSAELGEYMLSGWVRRVMLWKEIGLTLL